MNPIYQGGSDVNEKIDKCEGLYFRKGMDSVFKMTSASYPLGLDRTLANRGYQYQAETSVQISRLKYDEGSLLPSEQTVSLSEDVSDEWLSSFCEMSGISGTKQQVARQMLVNTIPAKKLASVSNDAGKIVACGLAVAQGDFVGLFDIVTHREYRRRGLARQLTLALLNWGKRNGAKGAYLQVAIDNEPATRLYSSIGFDESYRYWYRVKKLKQNDPAFPKKTH